MTIDVSEHAIWQDFAGPFDRFYADQFLNHCVAQIGPGDMGPWSPERFGEEFEGGFVRRFVGEVRIDDVLPLWTGLSATQSGWLSCVQLSEPVAVRLCEWLGSTVRPTRTTHTLACASGTAQFRWARLWRQSARLSRVQLNEALGFTNLTRPKQPSLELFNLA